MSLDLNSDFLQFKIAMPTGSKNGIYTFDRFKLDAEKLMLYRDEIEVTLPPKIVKTLAVLIENRGSILSKDELIEKVWADVIVEESNLSQNLYILRRSLGKKPDGSPYIETLRRRGYRFTADVRSSERPSAATVVEAPEPRRPASSVAVERQGNVLRLVERAVPERPVDATIPSVQTASAGKSKKPWYAFGILAFLLIAASGAALFYGLFASGSNLEKQGELTVTRLTNMNYVRDATISRDGNFFAYNEALGDSSRVWLQQTGKSARVEIIPAGKWQICCKSFSPDGKFLYFLATNEREKRNDLYRVSTLGGPPEKILSHVSGYISFSPDGEEILFLRIDTTLNERSLLIAASNGKGGERQILKSDKSPDLMFASWSPDGKTVAFQTFVQRPEPQPGCMLSTLDLATGAIKPISDERWGNCFRMEWLRDGSGIAMVGTKEGEGNSSRRDQVYLVSYPEGRSRRLTTEGIRHEPDSLGVTDDGAILAVPFNRSSQIWGMDSNGDSRTAKQLTSGTADGRASITPLADGRVGYIARSGDDLNIWLMNADGSDQTQIGEAAAVQDLAVTPDGKHFLYSNEVDGRSTLFRMGIDGVDPVQVTSDDEYVIDATVSPDGAWLAYDLWKYRGVDHDVVLKKVPFEGGEPVTLSNDDCSVPHFSPDGQYVSCVYFGKNQFAIISSVDGAKVAVFDTVKLPHLNTGGRWTPDSRALAYIVHKNNICNIWTQPINGGKPEQLTDFTSGSCYNLAFSQDGSRLYVARGHELRDAILITNFK